MFSLICVQRSRTLRYLVNTLHCSLLTVAQVFVAVAFCNAKRCTAPDLTVNAAIEYHVRNPLNTIQSQHYYCDKDSQYVMTCVFILDIYR